MTSSPSTDFSIAVLSWMNDSMREELAQRKRDNRRMKFVAGAKAAAFATLSTGMSLMFFRLVQF